MPPTAGDVDESLLPPDADLCLQQQDSSLEYEMEMLVHKWQGLAAQWGQAWKQQYDQVQYLVDEHSMSQQHFPRLPQGQDVLLFWRASAQYWTLLRYSVT